MFKKYHLNEALLILAISVITTFSFYKVNAHEDLKIFHKAHKPMMCILEEDRSWLQKIICKDATSKHKLCKLDQHCAIIKLADQQKIIDDLEKKIKTGAPVNCNSLTFSHVALSNASVFQEPSGNSKVIKKVKKGQEISFIGSTDKKNWIIVVPKDKTCTVGYINEKNIGLSTGSAASNVSKAPKIEKDTNIEITYPKWKTKNKLIVLDQDGFFEVDGFVNKELGINKVIINYDGNDEEMILGSDGSFNASLQIENTLDVRITSYKGKKQIGNVLTFKIEVE
jgi:hypothetical protein